MRSASQSSLLEGSPLEQKTDADFPQQRQKSALICLLIFVVVFAIHAFSPVVTLSDSAWSVALASSILHEFNTNLDEFNADERVGDWRVEHLPSGDYSYLPIGSPLLAVPFVWFAERISHWWFGIDDLANYLKAHPLGPIPGIIEQKFASLLIALTTLFIYLFAQSQVGTKRAIFIALIFAFGTSAWSTASRALWQHGPSMLMLSIVLWLLVKAERSPQWAPYVALPLAFSYVIRPTNSISLVVISLFVFFNYRHCFVRFIAWGSLIGVPFVVYNLSVYGAPLSTYYQASRIGATGQLGQALLGNLISPARGIFVYSPIFLFAIPVAWTLVRQRSFFASKAQQLQMAAVFIILAHWLAISSFPHWIGGWSLGPRLFTDMTPYWMVLLIPFTSRLRLQLQFRNLVQLLLFMFATLLSMAMHWHGASDLNVYYWNQVPNSVDEHIERIWDWSDPPFLRGFRQPLLRITPNAVQYSGGAQKNLQQVQLEISSLDTSRTSLRFVLPQGILPVRDDAFDAQFRISDESANEIVLETKESFGYGQRRTISLYLSQPAADVDDVTANPVQIFITTRNIWWTRRATINLPWQRLQIPIRMI